MDRGKTSLFVGDLPSSCTEDNLKLLFSQCGEVIHVKIITKPSEDTSDKPLRVSLCYGFVHMIDNQSALKALQELSGSFFNGRFLRVGWAQSKHAQGPYPLLQQSIINSIYVRFCSDEVRTKKMQLK